MIEGGGRIICFGVLVGRRLRRPNFAQDGVLSVLAVVAPLSPAIGALCLQLSNHVQLKAKSPPL